MSALKWLSILLLALLIPACLLGAAWCGWYYRGVQVAATAGAHNTVQLIESQQAAAALLEATRVATAASHETRRAADATATEITHALRAAGAADCPVPAAVVRVLDDQAADYNAATGR